MELDILEKVMKDREENEAQAIAKEALAAKNTSMATGSATDKQKDPMEEISQASIEQQFKSYLHTSKHIKQKLSRMNSALDTQEITTSQPVEAT